MQIQEVPEQISNMQFVNIQELLTYIYDNQIITEYWELSQNETNQEMLKKLNEAKKLSKSDFINI